ncbi:MAG: hypothetical protein DRQ49_05465 [Gammaproteobacteria bacterium]|nr:MAG: hypothetical protein DRQ49_05465 [Gammaproteobacteria bacterium]RKZ43250.1 MAG: hypothetical protein DRQ41_05740 [Gammaproteobacteria bacterium]RKZ75078.1 MAG: hypothetical protein DRQ57_08855 [Gammaproteobacteria bacterium]
MSSIHSAIRCLLIPVGEQQLLLPSTVITEVSLYHEPEPVFEHQPKWLLGIIDWRNQNIPLLSIEEALSLPLKVESSKKYHTVILYGLESTQKMPFYALRATDVPRSLAVTQETLTQSNPETQNGLVFNVAYESNKVLLPDVSYLENLLIKSEVFSYLSYS